MEKIAVFDRKGGNHLYILKAIITHPRRKKRENDGNGTLGKAGKTGRIIPGKKKKGNKKGRKAEKGKEGSGKKSSAGRAGLVYEPVPPRGVTLPHARIFHLGDQTFKQIISYPTFHGRLVLISITKNVLIILLLNPVMSKRVSDVTDKRDTS